MATDAEIFKKLKEATKGPTLVFPAVVVSVDEDAQTARVKPYEQSEMDVRLKSAEDESNEYFVIQPRVDSIVLVAIILNDESEAVLLKANEIDKFSVKIGDKSLEITSNEILFNGGANGGLINIQSLVERLNNIENKFNAHTHPGVTAGSATTGATVTLITPVTTVNNLEDKKVKH